MFSRLLVLVLAAFALAGCGDTYRYFTSGPVSWALKREIRDRAATRVVLPNLTDFAWDQLFLFSPYTPKADVCATLALSASDCDRLFKGESTDDGEMVLAFRRAGTVVHVELHYRWHGDFTPAATEQPISRDKAVFRVVRDGVSASGRTWLRLIRE